MVQASRAHLEARPRRLPQHLREQVERDLRWYRTARAEVAEANERIADLLSPTTAQLSHIGSQKGAPGNPTCNRGIAVAALRSRVRRQAFAVAAIERWLWSPAMHRDDRLLLRACYAMDRDDPMPLFAAAASIGIPCGTPAERRAVQDHLDALLRRAARALHYRGWWRHG